MIFLVSPLCTYSNLAHVRLVHARLSAYSLRLLVLACCAHTVALPRVIAVPTRMRACAYSFITYFGQPARLTASTQFFFLHTYIHRFVCTYLCTDCHFIYFGHISPLLASLFTLFKYVNMPYICMFVLYGFCL